MQNIENVSKWLEKQKDDCRLLKTLMRDTGKSKPDRKIATQRRKFSLAINRHHDLSSEKSVMAWLENLCEGLKTVEIFAEEFRKEYGYDGLEPARIYAVKLSSRIKSSIKPLAQNFK